MYSAFDCDKCLQQFKNAPILNPCSKIIFSQNNFNESTDLFDLNCERRLVLFEAENIFDNICLLWQQVEFGLQYSPNDLSLHLIHKQIIEALFAISICKDDWKLHKVEIQKCTNKLKKFVTSLSNWNSKIIKQILNNFKGIFKEYVHLYLDVQWLLLEINNRYDLNLLKNYENLIEDFVTISKCIFSNLDYDLVEKDMYPCVCFKQFMLLLQLMMENQYGGNEPFWKIVEKLSHNQDGLFSLWFTFNLAQLEGFDCRGVNEGPNNSRIIASHNFALETILKSILNSCQDINDTKLLLCLNLLDPLLNEWWTKSARADPYQHLWEFFSKFINSTEACVTKLPDTAEEILMTIKNLSKTSGDCFLLFLNLLQKHLVFHPNQWVRIKGRIYSRLPAHKINDFNDYGIYRISLLFISLASVVDLQEIAEKLQNLLSNLTHDRKMCAIVLNVQMALILTHVEKRVPISIVSKPTLRLVNEISETRSQFSLLKYFVDGLELVFNNSKELNLNQNVLFDSWVRNYLLHCQQSDLCSLLEVFLVVIKRKDFIWSDWKGIFDSILLELKSIAATATAPLQVGELAARIVQNDDSSHSFSHFMSETITPRVTKKYLCTLLGDYGVNHVTNREIEASIIEAWIRCCVLTTENNEELTRNVYKLHYFSGLFPNRCEYSGNVFCCLVKDLHHLSSTQPQKVQEICEIGFGHFDQWILPYITTPASEPLILHIYMCVGVLIYYCAPFLYHKSKPNCPFSKIVTTTLLPTDILMGKKPQQLLLNGIQKTLHLYLEGIYKLNCSTDPYLERTLKDIIVRYIITLPVTDSPFFKCFAKSAELLSYIFDKITATYLSYPFKCSEENSAIVLRFILSVLKSDLNKNNSIIVVKKTATGIFETIMFSNQKTIGLEIIKTIATDTLYGENRDNIKQAVMAVTEKHLAFNTTNYFQFLNVLIKIIPLDVVAVLPHIKNHINKVERMRGVGYDHILRRGLENIENFLTVPGMVSL